MIELKTLRLRDFTDDDIGHVFAGLSHPDVIRHYGVSYATLQECQAQMAWFKSLRDNDSGQWMALEALSGGAFLGAVGVSSLLRQHHSAELGYWLLPQFWGHGYMREALAGFLRHAFSELGLHRISAVVEVDNTASRKLLDALNFTMEGVQRDCEIKHGKYISLLSYSLLSSDPQSPY
ncbi:GNAT family N-acetyltransferase [Pseudoduganella violacea]|uniref:Ribosomal-protein-alanine N-acetyltransferase n=1 Tax=Pseudoduganella violacea TaxID=1715466 RepID=A0A7W5BF78_9BURK|nr:GNAT family N-acetyltransferase [Pseudoduganella violacea]MBB3122027.1 ribosomal-protein-alanine N-acetyltransferase [Pseudoduganella violacea]